MGRVPPGGRSRRGWVGRFGRRIRFGVLGSTCRYRLVNPGFGHRCLADGVDCSHQLIERRHERLPTQSVDVDVVRHGDDEHQAWLKQAIADHFAGRPVEAPRGGGNRARAEAAEQKLAMIADMEGQEGMTDHKFAKKTLDIVNEVPVPVVPEMTGRCLPLIEDCIRALADCRQAVASTTLFSSHMAHMTHEEVSAHSKHDLARRLAALLVEDADITESIVWADRPGSGSELDTEFVARTVVMKASTYLNLCQALRQLKAEAVEDRFRVMP